MSVWPLGLLLGSMFTGAPHEVPLYVCPQPPMPTTAQNVDVGHEMFCGGFELSIDAGPDQPAAANPDEGTENTTAVTTAAATTRPRRAAPRRRPNRNALMSTPRCPDVLHGPPGPAEPWTCELGPYSVGHSKSTIAPYVTALHLAGDTGDATFRRLEVPALESDHGQHADDGEVDRCPDVEADAVRM